MTASIAEWSEHLPKFHYLYLSRAMILDPSKKILPADRHSPLILKTPAAEICTYVTDMWFGNIAGSHLHCVLHDGLLGS